MTTSPLSRESAVAAANEILRRHAAVEWTPPVTSAEIDALHARMPPRHPDEPLADWLDRGLGLAPGADSESPSAVVLTFVANPRPKRRLVGQLLAMAAKTPGAGVPDLPPSMSTEDKRFFVSFEVADGRIEVGIQAVGRALVTLRNREVAACAPEPDGRTVAEVRLDAAGRARFARADSPEMRELLLSLQIWEI